MTSPPTTPAPRTVRTPTRTAPRPWRIAYVCPDPGVPVFGTKGSSVHVREIVRTLRRHGHHVSLYCLRTGGEAPPDLADVPVVGVKTPKAPTTTDDDASVAARERAVRERVIALQRRVADDGPFDLVYERYALFSAGTADRDGAAGLDVLEVNAPLPEEAARHRGLVGRDVAGALSATALHRASVVTAVSDPVADWVRGEGRTGPLLVTPNGVDVHRVRPAPRPVGPTWTVGFTGSFRPWHGTTTLVRAFVRLAADDPHVRLLLVGDGPQLPAVLDAVAAAGLTDRVESTGAVSHDEVLATLRRMDVATAPYDDPGQDYFSPLKVFEYLAAGLPVVASDVGQLRSVLRPGGGPAGTLVAPGD